MHLTTCIATVLFPSPHLRLRLLLVLLVNGQKTARTHHPHTHLASLNLSLMLCGSEAVMRAPMLHEERAVDVTAADIVSVRQWDLLHEVLAACLTARPHPASWLLMVMRVMRWHRHGPWNWHGHGHGHWLWLWIIRRRWHRGWHRGASWDQLELFPLFCLFTISNNMTIRLCTQIAPLMRPQAHTWPTELGLPMFPCLCCSPICNCTHVVCTQIPPKPAHECDTLWCRLHSPHTGWRH